MKNACYIVVFGIFEKLNKMDTLYEIVLYHPSKFFIFLFFCEWGIIPLLTTRMTCQQEIASSRNIL